MILTHTRLLRQTLSAAVRRLRPRVRPSRFATGLTLLCMVLALAGPTLQAGADPVRIFLYQTGGTQEVTSTYSYQQHHVYDPLGHLIGNVDASGYTYSLSGQQIGYVILIYMYGSGGTPIEVTASCHYQQHHVYDPLGNLVGNVDNAGAITDTNGASIGYMTFVP